jgi:hypothetical protein
MQALLPKNFLTKDTPVVTLATEFGISSGRVIQFLNLTRIPVDLRGRLKEMEKVTEGRLRGIVQMDPATMRTAVRGMLGFGVMAKGG